MNYASNMGSRVAFEVAGQGPTLIMQHGLFSNRQSWRDRGFVDALHSTYQLVLVDSLGHGDSDTPHNVSRYGLQQRAGDIAAVLDALQVERAHYVGYSMGGWIGTGVARYHPDRLLSLAIGGWDVKNGVAAASAQMQFNGFAELIAAASAMDNDIAAGIDNGDLVALEACWDALDQIDGAVSAIADVGVPTFLWCGRNDPYFSAVEALGAEMGVDFLAVDGDHVGAMTDHAAQSVVCVRDFLNGI
jgi:pimeloyl-ACP methyl ester carboxylesterase